MRISFQTEIENAIKEGGESYKDLFNTTLFFIEKIKNEEETKI